MVDVAVNFAAAVVSTAPSPATSGTSITVGTGQGARFPDPGAGTYNVIAVPNGTTPDQFAAQAEIVTVTVHNPATDTFTIVRAQEGTTARSIGVGWLFFMAPTAKFRDDILTAIAAAGGGAGPDPNALDVTSYGAVGDALPINITITSGSAAATLTTGTIPSSGFSGKRVVIQGAGAGGVPLVTTISARTDSTHITLANAASTSVTAATAYWGTDSSSGIASARDAWQNGAVAYTGGNNGDRILQKYLYFPPGKYIVTAQDALANSPTTGTAAVLRNGLIKGGWGMSEGVEIIFATTVNTTSDPRNGNLMTLANRWHGFRVQGLKVRSLNANQSFAYLWCSVTNDGTYPNFGSGSQRRIHWDTLDFRGTWNRGIGLDGDSAANLNSEQMISNIYINDSCSFADAFFHSGITNPTANAQQDQFVNYIIENCILEYNDGDCFKFNRGGHITCIGGSFVGGVQGGSVRFFALVQGGGNYWKDHLEVVGTRFECRTSGSRVLYSEWRDQITHVAFNNCAMSANAVAGDETNMAFIEIINNGASSVGHGNYRFVNCEIPGYIRFQGLTTQNFGRIVVDQCNFTHNWSGLSTEAAATGAIRYGGSFAPKYRFRDCWNITDAAN